MGCWKIPVLYVLFDKIWVDFDPEEEAVVVVVTVVGWMNTEGFDEGMLVDKREVREWSEEMSGESAKEVRLPTGIEEVDEYNILSDFDVLAGFACVLASPPPRFFAPDSVPFKPTTSGTRMIILRDVVDDQEFVGVAAFFSALLPPTTAASDSKSSDPNPMKYF